MGRGRCGSHNNAANFIASTQYYLKLTAEVFPDVLKQMEELTGYVFPEIGGILYEEE